MEWPFYRPMDCMHHRLPGLATSRGRSFVWQRCVSFRMLRSSALLNVLSNFAFAVDEIGRLLLCESVADYLSVAVLPMQYSFLFDRVSSRSPTMAGVALNKLSSFAMILCASCLYSGPIATAKIPFSRVVRYIRSPARTVDAYTRSLVSIRCW